MANDESNPENASPDGNAKIKMKRLKNCKFDA